MRIPYKSQKKKGGYLCRAKKEKSQRKGPGEMPFIKRGEKRLQRSRGIE